MKYQGFAPQLNSELSTDARRVGWLFIPSAIIGMIVLPVHAPTIPAAAIYLLWAFACMASGYVLGFLFGIPKILQTNAQGDLTQVPGAYRQQVNTNLEQISDWLTKIIIGLGLINLAKIPGYLTQIADTLTVSAGMPQEDRAFALAVIVYFSLLGFICGYLFTRLFLAGAFSRADQAAATANATIKNMKSLARELDPVLFRQVMLGTSSDKLIDGETINDESAQNDTAANESDDFDGDADEPERLDKELYRLRGEGR